ncbi:unnamed protein product [Cyprideis torosa]|uniref:Uncharacterized protein n=1 Tax=Cyprideis torosa TaxID=163714 RepID=A0A7R8WEX5_9CRUS|nr:unnamed protein product [Cyprideis torosa]CAG0891240.1 unnamed protein product [Cyprideis torosa]
MEQFDQLLTCPICLDRYKNPKLLPCQHSFCLDPCMEGLIDYVRRQVKCPECRAEHRIPYQGITQFPNNVTLQRFLEIHADITGELPDPNLGQTMERCGVCSERSFVSVCAHCEKKICHDCKEGHMQVLRREIHRFCSQVKRSIHRLTDMSEIIDKNATHLQTNCAKVLEEIEDMCKRLQKAIQEKEASLKLEVETYLSSELRNLSTVKENLDVEIMNIKNNCDLVENNFSEENEWDDAELLETKDIFVKTVDFVRNFEHEAGCSERDYTRKVRLQLNQDPNHIQLGLSNLAEINIHTTQIGTTTGPQSTQSAANLALSRSKSDHRLAVQFRENERFGSDNDSLGRRVYGEEEHGPTRRSSRYKSRFHRTGNLLDPDSDTETRTSSPIPPREKVLDTDDAIKGPLSGITRLWDAPRILLKISETEKKKEKKERMAQPPPQPTPAAPVQQAPAPQPQPPPALQPPPTRTQRQVSEEDEIAKQKRMNREWADRQPGGATANPPSESQPPKESSAHGRTSAPSSRPASRQSSTMDESGPSTPTSRAPSRQTSKTSTTEEPPRRTTSRQEPVEEERPVQVPWRVGNIRKRVQEEESESTADDASSVGRGSGAKSKSGASSSSSTVTAGGSRSRSSPPSQASEKSRKPSGGSATRNRRASSDSSTSTSSSRSSSPPKTGAAFATKNIRQRFEPPLTTVPPPVVTAPPEPPYRARIRASEPPASAPSSSSTTTGSRFLGHRSGTHLKESVSSDESSDSEAERGRDSRRPSNASSVSNVGTGLKKYEERSDIGPLLARSAHARSREHEAPTSNFSRSRTASNLYRGTSFDESEPSYRRPDTTTGASNYRARRFGRYDAPDTDTYSSDRYSVGSGGLTGKYYNRSRGNLYDDYSSRHGGASGYTSRYLNRSKSSAALDGPEGEECHQTSEPVRRSSLAQAQTTAPPPAPAAPSEEKQRRKTWATRSTSSSKPEEESTATNDVEGAIAFEEVPGESHLSSWARYLKNKYGNRYKEASRLSKSRSYGSFGGNHTDSSDDSDAEETNATRSSASAAGLIDLNSPRSQYLKKRKVMLMFGTRGSGQGAFTWPRGVAVTPENNIVVADSSNHRIQVFTEKGQFMKEIGQYGTGEGEFDCLAGVAINRIGQFIVSDRYNHRVQVLDPNGRYLRSFGSQGAADGRFNYPWGLATDALGFIYVCDKENHRIQVFQSDGTFVGKFGALGKAPGQLDNPHYIAVSSTNRIVVSDSNNHRIQIFDINGKVSNHFGNEGSEEGQFKYPRGVAVDEGGYIFVADSGNNRVQLFAPDGQFLRAFGTWGAGEGQFKAMEGIAVSTEGHIIVCDRENHRIQVF